MSAINTKIIALVAMAFLSVSCTGMFDNVREFAEEETVYVGRLDGVQQVRYGYERVEIDLMAEGRLRSSQMQIGRATKTVVECPYFEEEGHRRVIDTLASWLNITGLTRADAYDFTIYTEDDYGNKSLPITAQIQPFTSENLKSLALAQPSVTESDVAAQLEWREPQSNVTYTMYGYKYSYVDKDGNRQAGAGEGDMPVFLVENVEADKDVQVDIECDIVPNFMNSKGVYIPLLDRIAWNTAINVHISSGANPAIFLKSPQSSFSFDFEEATYPIAFSWTSVPASSGYTIKLSTSSGFEASNTVSFDVGKVTEYELSKDDFNLLISKGRKIRETELFWTVEAVGVDNVKTQTRKLSITRKPKLVGQWKFDNESNLFEATVGNNLSALGAKTVLVATGPTPGNGAAEVSSGSYLRLKHGLPSNTKDFTISMYINMPWRDNHPLVNFNQGDGNPAEFSVDVETSICFATGAKTDRSYGATATLWHLMTLTVSNGALMAYVDGELVLSSSSSSDRYTLTESYMTLFADGGGANAKKVYIADLALWDMPLEQNEIHAYYKLKRVNYQECSIASFSSEAMTSPENIISGTMTGTAYYGTCNPLMAVIDMGKKRNLAYVVVGGYIWASADAKYFDLSVSDNGAAYAQFTPIGTINNPAGGWKNGTFYTIDLSETEAKGRYLKVSGRDPWEESNPYMLMSEVIMYEWAE